MSSSSQPRGLAPAADLDPRQAHGAEIIDLASRSVLPQVARGRRRSDSFGLAAGAFIVAALGAVTLWSMNAARQTSQPPIAAPPMVGMPPPPVPIQAITPYPAGGQPLAAPQAALAGPAPQPVLAAPPLPQIETGPAASPYLSPTVVFDGLAPPPPMAAAPATPLPGGAEGPAGKAPAVDDFAARLGGLGGAAATATASVDPRTTVTQGTLIPAILETAIDTDVPGYVRAVVSTDVRSFDGMRVLVPRSSRLIGQYKSGLQAGQKRAYVIWTRLIRPDGVSVDLASPAVGFAGQTGIEGKVDSRFFERFGSAILLSVIGGVTAPAGNAGLVIAGGGQSAAATALDQTGKIAPTIRVRQGEPVRVFTARDLDFSKVAGS